MLKEKKSSLKYQPDLNKTDELIKNLSQRQYSFKNTALKIIKVTLASIIGRQFIWQIQIINQKKLRETSQKLLQAYKKTLRPMSQSIILFSLKILIDTCLFHRNILYNQFQKGALTGLLFYLINRPIIQISSFKDTIQQNKKSISTLDSIFVINKNNGFRGFYRFENLLGPFNTALFRGMQFGSYSQLGYLSNHFFSTFFIFPLCSTLLATISTLHLQKCRNIYMNIHLQRFGKVNSSPTGFVIFPKRVSKQVYHNRSEIFHFTPLEVRAHMLTFFKNWIFFSCFIASQKFKELSSLAQQSFQSDYIKSHKKSF